MTLRLDDVAARATAQSLDAMLAALEELPESAARSFAFDAIDALLQLHGEALARLIVAHHDGRLSDEMIGRDEVLTHLLGVHDLLPKSARPPDLVQLELRRDGTTQRDDALVGLAGDSQTQCQLCAEPIDQNHQHLIDLERQEMTCACRACAILFDGRSNAGSRYKLVPHRYRSLDHALLDDGLWDTLDLPVDVAFMFMSSRATRLVAFYPGPMGTTESALPLPSWDEIVEKIPLLGTLEPDVEAVLVRRNRGAREHWIVPVDECYRLAGIMRTTWQGISGGDTMRAAVDAFFRQLAKRDASRARATPDPSADTSAIHSSEVSCATT